MESLPEIGKHKNNYQPKFGTVENRTMFSLIPEERVSNLLEALSLFFSNANEDRSSGDIDEVRSDETEIKRNEILILAVCLFSQNSLNCRLFFRIPFICLSC